MKKGNQVMYTPLSSIPSGRRQQIDDEMIREYVRMEAVEVDSKCIGKIFGAGSAPPKSKPGITLVTRST